MAILRRYNKYQGLKDIDVLIEDDAPISQYFNVAEVPDIISQGRSSFLVGGSSLLKNGVELKFELINDATGKTIYLEPVSNYLEGDARRISVEIYDDAETFGDATLYCLGELNPNEVDVPAEWRDIYNVRWYRKIYISGAGTNSEPIYFYNQPSMWVGEIVKGFVETSFPTGSVQQTGEVSGEPLPGTEGTNPSTEEVSSIKVLQKGFKSKVFGGGGKNAGVSRRGRKARRASPEVDKFSFSIEDETSKSDVRHVGATFKVNNPQPAESFELESYHEVPTIYETDIVDVKTDKQLVPAKEFVITDTRFPEDDERRKVIVPLAKSPYTMSFQPAPTHSVSTVNFRSFADVRISKMRTFSGDVHRVKLYAKNKDAFGDFELIADTPIESPEILFDVFSSAGSKRIGYFNDQSTLDDYWSSASNTTASLNSTYILDSVHISGSNSQPNELLKFQITGSRPIEFYKGIDYSIRARIIGEAGPKSFTDGEALTSFGELGIFLSGSSFETNHNFGNEYGFQLTPPGESTPGSLTIESVDGPGLKDFGIVEEVFTPLRNGEDNVLQFGIPAGNFYISDISITPVADTGFSPDWIKIVAPVPPFSQERPDDYEFMAEFYDVNNNVADTVTHVSASTFVGANNYIVGSDNVLSGSMFIGSAIGSGIEMAGVSSGFIRSIGYKGFTSASAYPTQGPGFLMYSGSVLTDVTDDYSNGGIGLELVGHSGSYLRFRTNPSELDIRTDAFFIGQEPLQYISGSEGNIEISSSLFHLDPKNERLVIGADATINADLTVNNIRTPAQIGGAPSTFANASASITSQGNVVFRSGSIANWKIFGSKLSGSNATLDADGAALYMSDKGPNTDNSATFDIQRDEYYIDFTPADQGNDRNYYVKFGPNFAVDSDGVLIASGAVFEGQITASTGLIGGASIESASLAYSPFWRISSSADQTDPTSFISSSEFKVSAGGLVTGSAILLGDKGGGNYLQFIDDTLTVEGNITVNSIKTPATIGGVASTTLNSSASIESDGFASFKSASIGGFHVSSDTINDTNDRLILKSSGQITGSKVLFSGGNIGGWTINETNITSPGAGIRLNANGDNSEISINSHTFANEGIQLGFNGGSPRFYAGDGAQNFLRYDSSNGVSIKTTLFELDTPTLELSTTHASMSLGSSQEIIMRGNSNSPFIAIQPSVALQDKAYGEIGIMLAVAAGTTPLFSAVGTGGHIKFNGTLLDISTDTAVISGSSIQLVTPTFLLGSVSDGNYISGSNGNMEIQSNAFELDANNIEISSTNASMSIGETSDGGHAIKLDGAQGKVFVGSNSSKQIEISGNHAKGYIATGKNSVDSTTEGFWFANNNANPEFHIGDATDFIKLQHGNLDIASQKLEISASTIQVSTTHASMSFGHNSSYPQGKLIVEGSGTPTFKMGPDVGFISMTTGSGVYMDGDGNFRFGDDDGGITFNNGSFAITGSDLDISVTELNIVATGFELSSQEASMSLGTNRQLHFQGGNANPYISIGMGGSGSYGTEGVWLAHNNTQNRPQVSFVGSAGHFKFDTGVDIDTRTFELDANNGDLQISSTQKSMSLNDQTIVLDGTNAKITIGSANPVIIQGGATDNFMTMGSKTSFTHFDQSTQGIIVGMDSTVPKFEMVGSATNYLSYDGSNFDIKLSQGLELDATNIELSSTHASMSLGEGKIKMVGASTSFIQIGAANSITLKDDGTDRFMSIGKTSFSHFDQSTAGFIVGTDGGTTKFELAGSATNYLSFDGSNFDIKLSQGLELDASNIELSSTQASMSLGEGKIVLQGASSPFMAINSGSANQLLVKTDGTDAFMTMGSKTSFSDEGSGTAGILIGMDASNPQAEFVKSSTNYFIFDGSSGVDIKTTALELDANDGDLQLSSTHKSMSLGDGKIKLQGAATPFVQIGSSNPITLKTDGTDQFIVMGSKTSFTHYDKSTVGIIMGMDTAVPKFELAKDSKDYLRWDSTDGLDIRTRNMEVSASNIQISSVHASMSIGDPDSAGGAIVLHADGTDKMIKFGDKTTFDQTTTAGLIMGMDATNPEFDYTVGTANSQYIRMTPAGIDIKTPSFNLDTDRLDISSDDSRIDVYDDSGGVDGSDLRVRIGEVDPTSANHYGMVIYDGTGSGSADELVHFSDVKNQIASWSLSPNQISSQNLILDSSGIIQTSDFASGVKGWRITSANNGEAEFEKVTVRGTLATTVFEKESVNAVGGQLYVANSTIYTGSAQLSATETTMSVANVGGFAAGEILSAKKISDTGFKTEYMKVNSASRDYPNSDKDLTGKLYVTRGYSGSLPGTHDTGSLGDSAQASQTYENGQVIVSTGKVGTGFIRLNANPSDQTTPYIDIVERTGSAIYDISLKARLGDLSGLSSGLLYGETNPGFGLFTENVFLQGAITAQTGSITGILHIDTDANNKMKLGTNVQSTNDGIYLNNNNYWYTNDAFRIGDTNNYFEWDTSTLTIKPEVLEINAGSGDFQISSTHKSMSLGDGDIKLHSPTSAQSTMRIGSTTTKAIFITGSNSLGAIRSGKSSVSDTTEGFWLANNNQQAEFVVGDDTDFLKFHASASVNSLEMKTRKFELDANTGDLQLSSTQHSMSFADGTLKLGRASNGISYLRVGSTLGKDVQITGSATLGVIRSGKTSAADTTEGFWLANNNADAEFVIGDSTDFIKFDDNELEVKTRKLELDAGDGDVQISTTHASMSLGGKRITLKGDSNPFITINSGSANDIKLKTDGTDAFMTMGSKDDFGDEGTGTAGILIGMDSNNPQAEFVKDSSNYFIFDNGVDIKTIKFELDASNLELSSTHSSMSLGEGKLVLQGSSTPFIAINSGSANDIKLKTDGTDAFMTMGSKDDFSDEGKNTAGILIGMDSNNPQAEFVKDSSNYFIFDDGVDIKTDTFQLDAGPGDLQISSTQKSMSLAGGAIEIAHSGSNQAYMKLGSTGGQGIEMTGSNYGGTIRSGKTNIDDTDSGFFLNNSAGTSQFHVGDATDALKFNGSKFEITSSHMDVSGQDVTFDIQNFELGATDLSISSTHKSMSLGYNTSTAHGVTLEGGSTSRLGFGTKGNYRMQLVDNGSDSFLQIGTLAFDSHTNTGILIGNDGGNFEMRMYKDSDEYFTFDGTDGLDIRSTKIYLSTGEGLTLSGVDSSDASNNYLALGSATSYAVGEGFWADGDGFFRVGKPSTAYVSYDATNEKFHIKTADISIDTNKFDLIASSSGEVRLSMGASPPTNFSSDGIILSGSGYFNFQKNSLNYIKHDSDGFKLASQDFQLSGSTTLAINTDTIKLGTNATSTLVHGSTGTFLNSSGHFSFVEDSLNYIKGGNSDFEIRSQNFRLSGSTTLAIDTSKIRLGSNATSTLVHGSDGIFLNNSGHFSFVEDSLNFIKGGNSNFEISSQNFRLSGSTTLAIDTSKIRLGSNATTTLTHGSVGIFLNSSGHFSFKEDANNYIVGGNNNFDIAADNFTLDATTIYMDSATNSGMIGLGTDGSAVTHGATGIYLDGTGKFSFVEDSANFIKGGNSNFEINAEKFDLITPQMRVSSSNGGTIAMGSTIPKNISGSGVFLSGSGDFLAGNGSGNSIKYNATSNAIVMQSNTFSLNASTIVIDSSTNNGKIALGASPNTSVAGTNAGIYIDGGGNFLAYGDGDNYLRKSGTGLDIKAASFDLNAGSGKLVIGSATPSIALTHADATFSVGTITTDSDTTGQGVFMDGGGHFRVIGNATNQLIVDGGSMTIKSDTFNLAANTDDLVIDSSGKSISLAGGKVILDGDSNSGNGNLSVGTLTSIDPNTTNVGMYVVGNGELLLKSGDGENENYIKMTDDGLELQTSTLKFTVDGNIESQDFLVERSRLFGAGADGDVNISSNTTLTSDMYYRFLTINSGITLSTAGYRVFVSRTFTNNGTIENDGHDGTSMLSEGTGGPEGTLSGGTPGAHGGAGGTAGGSGGRPGGDGGSSGGSGGFLLLFAREIVNNGTIRANGGDGADGGQAKSVEP